MTSLQWCPMATVVLLLLAVLVTSETEISDPPVYVGKGKSVSLKCGGRRDMTGNKFKYWELAYKSQRLYNDPPTPSVQVLDQGWTLYVASVTAAYYGPYVCAYNTSSDEQVYYKFHLLEIRTSTFSKFRLSIIIGVVAAVAALVVSAAICIIYNYKYETRHGGEGKGLVEGEHPQPTSSSAVHPEAYTNEVYMEDGTAGNDITVQNTKL